MFNSHIIKNRQNQQHYIIRLAYQGSPSRALKPEVINDTFTASMFVNSLEVPFGFWESFGSRNSFFSYFNWRSANPWKKIEEYAEAALVQGSMCAYKTIPYSELQETARQLTFKNSIGESIQVQPVSTLLLNNSADIKPVNTLSEAQQIMSQLTINDDELAQLLNANNIPVVKGNSNASIDALTAALLSGAFVVTVVPDARKPSTTMDYEMVGMSGPGNPPPRLQKEALTKVSAIKPPETMPEVLARMQAATEAVAIARSTGAPLPTSPYTLADKLDIVEQGLDEKYIVRIIESEYAKDEGTVGWVNPQTKQSTYWTTTYSQLEYADKDAELITSAVGKPYNKAADYTLLVIDADKAANQGDMKTFIPTYDNLTDFAKADLEDTPADAITACMTPQYSKDYETLIKVADKKKINLKNKQQFSKFSRDMQLTEAERKTLRARHEIDRKYGANEQFQGNGLTRNTDPDTGNVSQGMVETFSQDKNPKTLKHLEDNNILVRIAL